MINTYTKNSINAPNTFYFHYIILLNKDLDLTEDKPKRIAEYLIRKIEKENKEADTKVLNCVLEKANRAGSPHIHFLLKTHLDRNTLLSSLETIKKNAPSGLRAQKIIPKVTSIFTKYRGEMACDYYRDKEKCPGVSLCKRKDLDGTLLCKSNNNLKDCSHLEYLSNVNHYLSSKDNLENILFSYNTPIMH